jgi:hypothetical protein
MLKGAVLLAIFGLPQHTGVYSTFMPTAIEIPTEDVESITINNGDVLSIQPRGHCPKLNDSYYNVLMGGASLAYTGQDTATGEIFFRGIQVGSTHLRIELYQTNAPMQTFQYEIEVRP